MGGGIDIVRCEIAGIFLFKNGDPWVLSQFPMKLAVSHIHGNHLLGASLKEAVGKSTGGGTYVQECLSLHINGKGIQCRL